MLPPHDLFMPIMAASATFMAFVTLVMLRETFLGLLAKGAVRRSLERVWDSATGMFRNPRTRLMTMCWRSYSRIIDVTTDRMVFAAFHKERARGSWFSASRDVHTRLAQLLDTDSLGAAELKYAERYASFPTPVLVWISRYLARRLAKTGVSLEDVMSFLLDEQAKVSADAQSFRGHARRFRQRFGVSLSARLGSIDRDDSVVP